MEDSSHFVVFAFRNKMDEAYVEKYVKSIMETRGLTAEKLEAYKNMMVGDIVKGPRSTKVQVGFSSGLYCAWKFYDFCRDGGSGYLSDGRNRSCKIR